jgi:hypothetical protein
MVAGSRLPERGKQLCGFKGGRGAGPSPLRRSLPLPALPRRLATQPEYDQMGRKGSKFDLIALNRTKK